MRSLVSGQAFTAVGDEFVLACLLTVFEADKSSDGFAPVLIGSTDDGCFHYSRMPVQDVFDLARPHLVARTVDHVLHAVDDEQPAVLVHVAHVPGAQFAAGDISRGGFGIVEVGPGDDGTAHTDFADLPGTDLVAVKVDDPIHRGRQRQASRQSTGLFVNGCAHSLRHSGGLAGGFRQAVALADVVSRALFELFNERFRYGCSTGVDRSEVVELSAGELRVGQQCEERSCRAGHSVRLLFTQHAQHRGRFEPVVHDERARTRDGCQHLGDEARNVEDRSQGEVGVLRAVAVLDFCHLGVVGDGHVQDLGTF